MTQANESANRIDATFARLSQAGRKGLWPYVTAGYPDLDTTIGLLKALDQAGVAGVELGFPYSDPVADGPVIQTSFSRALASGFRVGEVFERIGAVRGELSMPLLAMVSFSIVHRIGPSTFIERAARSGFDGLIIPDLSLEEAADTARQVTDAGLRLVMLVSPTTSPERRERIAKLSSGFVYYLSVAGITGERDQLPPDLPENVARLRTVSGRPVCVGFGISQPRHVEAVCAVADGAIVGSAIVRRINGCVDRQATGAEIIQDVSDFVAALQAPLT
jgi:tryptophan synthase alpha chain